MDMNSQKDLIFIEYPLSLHTDLGTRENRKYDYKIPLFCKLSFYTQKHIVIVHINKALRR